MPSAIRSLVCCDIPPLRSEFAVAASETDFCLGRTTMVCAWGGVREGLGIAHALAPWGSSDFTQATRLGEAY